MIVEFPHNILSERCDRIDCFHDGELISDVKDAIDSMRSELIKSGGVGLAAPQVGLKYRIIAFDAKASGIESNVTFMIDPIILKKGNKIHRSVEGCLSIPGRKFLVERYVTLWLKYKTIDGTEIRHVASGFEARIIQHELDHLDGITIIDRGTEL